LIALAYEGLSGKQGSFQGKSYDQAVLEQAYQHCSRLTAQHSRSFYLASALLPVEERSAMRALYAFCRTADDLVDRANLEGIAAEMALAEWRRRSMKPKPVGKDFVALAWADTCRRYLIPVCYAEQLLAGVGRDLRQTRYQTFAELTEYAYGVASTVGLMSMYITGFRDASAIPYAVKLGVALQMTNILRDVGEDWRAGRVYLPAEELAAFGLSEADLAAGQVDDRWRNFMGFQIERNRWLYAEAWPGIALLAPQGRLAVGAAAEFYSAILNDIEAHDYDVFRRRAHLGAVGKLARLPGLWWRLRFRLETVESLHQEHRLWKQAAQ
jgi:phytoene synthase